MLRRTTTVPTHRRMQEQNQESYWHLEKNQLVLIRQWVDQIQASISHADSKASILLGLSGTALALLPAKILRPVMTLVQTRSTVSWAKEAALLVADITGVVGLSLLGACVVLLILAVRPRLGTEPVYGSPIGAGDLSVEEITTLVRKADRSPDAAALAREVGRLSHIATTKFQLIRSATTLLLACVLPLIISMELAVKP